MSKVWYFGTTFFLLLSYYVDIAHIVFNFKLMSRYGYVDKEDLFTDYLKEIGRHPLLTLPEEKELGTTVHEMMVHEEVRRKLKITIADYAHARKIDYATLQAIYKLGEAAKKRMIECNLRLVVSVAKRYNNINLPIYDMVQEGNIGLIRGVEKYNPVDYTVKLSTYVSFWIKEAINKGISNTGRTIRLPVHVTDKIRMVRRTNKEFIVEHGRNPTRQELTELTGLKDDNIRRIMMAIKKPSSLNINIETKDSGVLSFLEYIPDPTTLDPNRVNQEEVSGILTEMLSCLDARERAVLMHLRGLFNAPRMSKEELGEHFKVCPGRIKQIEREVIKKLRKEFTAVPEVREMLSACLT